MCGQFDLKPLFLGKLRPEGLTSNQMVSQQQAGFAWRHKQPIYFFRPQWAGVLHVETELVTVSSRKSCFFFFVFCLFVLCFESYFCPV